jgi:hypothetical protein
VYASSSSSLTSQFVVSKNPEILHEEEYYEEVSLPLIKYASGDIFDGCRDFKTKYVHLVECITSDAFNRWPNLTTVYLSSVKCISGNVFNGCDSLKEVYASSLEEIKESGEKIKGSWEKIKGLGRVTFSDCFGVEKMFFLKLKKVEGKFLFNCPNIEVLVVPLLENVEDCFLGILNDDYFKRWNKNKPEDKLEKIYCPELKHAGARFLARRHGTVQLPKLESIGNFAFFECTFVEINLPSVKYIGNNSFNGCYNLKAVYCDSLEEIGSMAFSCCWNLEEVFFPVLKKVGRNFLFQCPKLKKIYLGAPNIVFEDGAFETGAKTKNIDLFICNNNQYLLRNIGPFKSVQVYSSAAWKNS